MGRTTLQGYICERCGHKWFPRIYKEGELPTICPSCKSPYWDRPKKKGGKA